MYLKETSFSSLGFNLYLRLFEPFLKAILNEEGYRWLATLLLQEQHTKASYLDSHKNMLTFLTKE